jgi:hypothetical protein
VVVTKKLSMSDFQIILTKIFIVGSPFFFILGLIITAIDKRFRKVGLALVIGSVIFFIIGFGICLNNFGGLKLT